jgi:hypothetical protein
MTVEFCNEVAHVVRVVSRCLIVVLIVTDEGHVYAVVVDLQTKVKVLAGLPIAVVPHEVYSDGTVATELLT